MARKLKDQLPLDPAPMLCTLVDRSFDDEAWIFEPKYDGLRVLCRFDGETLTLKSRNGKPQEFRFPDVANALLEALRGRGCGRGPAILDGEVVCLDERGNPSFQSLQQRLHLTQESVVRERMAKYPAYLYLFDVLYQGSRDVTGLPLVERKKILHQAVGWNDRIRETPVLDGEGERFYAQTCRDRGEGIVAKTKRGLYSATRGADWVKIKCILRQEFAIVGYTDPKGARTGIGAILVAYYEKGKLRYAGKVGTGFDAALLNDLRRRLEPRVISNSPLAKSVGSAGVHWVKPELVAEIGFSEWTRDGSLRHPRFEGLRPDKAAREVVREESKHVEETLPLAQTKTKQKKSSGKVAPAAKNAPLEKYNRMRDFGKTREPRGKAAKGHERPIFVIQEHHATRLHYDFRLESGGVLRSWAVTNEPTLDPRIKRLAIEVEDHPLDYASFEGEIPQGEYGGGQVSIWDHGTYESLNEGSLEGAIRDGKVKFRLDGARMKGLFSLIRIRGRDRKPHWLLIKSTEGRVAAPTNHAATAAKSTATAKSARPAKSAASSKLGRSSRVKRSQARGTEAAGRTGLIVSGKPEPVEWTHEDKLMFPKVDATKGEVLSFYRRIAPRLLPYLRNRPVTLERLPDGLVGEKAPRFWQKNTPAYYPKWIPRLRLPSETGKAVDYAVINDVETLLYLVNQGALTFHIWASRAETLDRPDFVLFDLDPGEAPFGDVVKLALSLRKILEARGIDAYVKTSGKTGLHILCPWNEPGDHDRAREWALEIAGELVEAQPKIVTIERSKAGRDGRTYVDVMQNARGHHVVPPYVLRAVPEATVSTPLEWNELKAKLRPGLFDLRTVFKRLGPSRADPMEPVLDAVGVNATPGIASPRARARGKGRSKPTGGTKAWAK